MIFLIYTLIVNIIAFCAFALDKHKAQRDKWRISEASLLLTAVFGGALGAWLGMILCHHKTKHKKFRYFVPLLMVIQIMAIVLIGGSLYLLDYSLKPAVKAKRNAESITYLQEYYPGTAEWIDSMQTAGALRDTFITNQGLRLHAFYAAHPDAKGTVVLVHGYTDCAFRMTMLGKLYYENLGFNVILPDHAAHGESEGEVIQMGWLDRLNIERWTQIADSLWAPSPIYLHGISMGAATVMMCSGDPLPTNVRGIIDDCGYTSVWDEFSGEIHNQFHLPVHPLMDIASRICKWKYGWDFKEASALAQVERSTLPMLFIHGDSDTFVPTAMVYKLYKAKSHGYKKLWITEGTTHALSYHDYPERYLHEIEDFISKSQEAK